MRNHTKIYLTAFGLDLSDSNQYVRSELSDTKGVDIHHIVNREDRIENLMLLNRDEHVLHGEIKSSMYMLLWVHRAYLEEHGIEYDNSWFEKYLQQYKEFRCE